jgi:SAM-dependent methyltransferase
MIPLDGFEKWSTLLDEYASQYLNEVEHQEYEAIPDPEKLNQLKAILEKPIARFSPVNEVYFRAKWADVLHAAHAGKTLTILEVASGDTDIIPQMMARIRPNSRYITANMNRILTQRLRKRTRDLPVEMVVIEEDAAKIGEYLAPDSVDIIAFQHAVNDVVQAILCAQQGVDTVYTDWMATLPKMIRILQEEFAQNTLEQHARPGFLSLLEKLFKVLKPGGIMVMSHYQFQLDLDWGYPPDLWNNFIPITREWIKDMPGYSELFFEGFNPHWWLFSRKV